MKSALLLPVLLLLLAAPGPAPAAPPFVPVQGVLRDSGGNLVDGEVIVTFSIYAGPAGGAALWTETQTALIDRGLMSVYLGQVMPLSLSLFRDHDDLWLGIMVGADSEMERIFLGSTPFAGYAAYSGSGGGGGDYDAGYGLDLGGSTFSVDPTVIQARVTGVCPVGAINAVNQDGTVACTQGGGTRPEILHDTDWFPFPFRSTGYTVTSPVPGADFVFATARGWDGRLGQVIAPAMEAVNNSFPPAYVAYSRDAAGIYGQHNLMRFSNPGGRNSLTIEQGDVRYLFVARAPDYDSGWQAAANNTTYPMNHDLGVFPSFALVEVAQNDDGSGWRVPTMGASTHDGSGWRQTAVVELGTDTYTVRTTGDLASFRDIDGNGQSPAAGFWRVRLFDWTPDYDSGWQPYSTAESTLILAHGLGVTPSLFMLYLAENPDGSGWCLPAMGKNRFGGYNAVGVYALNATYVTLASGTNRVAQFATAAGDTPNVSEGYVRFFAWR